MNIPVGIEPGTGSAKKAHQSGRRLALRHATALPHGRPGLTDDERPLNEEGEREAVHVGVR